MFLVLVAWAVAAAGGMAVLGSALWWMLGDLILDHLGTPLADWASDIDDEDVLGAG